MIDPVGEPTDVHELLERSRALGFLGPGPVDDHLDHARRLIEICQDISADRGPWLDLGSGGGLPGLVIAAEQREQALVLLDSSERRCAFLREACTALDRPDVEVVCARAEDAARNPALREHFAVVIARSFGRPAVTAECAAGFLPAGGFLVVSDRMDDFDLRWPAAPMQGLGFDRPIRRVLGDTIAMVARRDTVSDAIPRRNGVPSKRPLW